MNFTELVNKISAISTMTSGELATILAYIIDYRETVACDYTAMSMQRDTLQRNISRLNNENDELLKRIKSLEEKLEAKGNVKTITVKLGELIRMAERSKSLGSLIVEAQNTEGLFEMSNGKKVHFPVIVEICSAVAAFVGLSQPIRFQMPHLRDHYVSPKHSYCLVKSDAEYIIKKVYSDFDVVVID